ncbi:MAG: ATP-binding protein [Thaumarchaeota archaeon]|nr:ATP-binding protein [Nitrososphaerota archaeon]
MKKTLLSLHRKSVVIILAIVTVAVILSVAAFLSYDYTSSNITSSAIQSIHSNAQVQASDMSNLIAAKLEAITTNLQVISAADGIITYNVSAVNHLLEAAQNSTSDVTYTYAWVNATGIPIANSNQTLLLTAQRLHINVSQQAYFSIPKETGRIYFSTNYVSVVNGGRYVVLVQPVFRSQIIGSRAITAFDGILTASISVSSLGRYVQDQLASHFQSSMGIIDPTGVILYSANETLVGTNVFGAQFQRLLPDALKQPFDTMLNQSLKGITGFQDFTYNGVSGGLAYQPVLVKINDKNHTAPQEFAILYISAPDLLAEAQASQINLLGQVTYITVLGIGASSLAACLVVIRWNKRLDDTVKQKTADLLSSNDQLVLTNDQLANANRQLEEQAMAQKDLINIAAHELRTPTQSILASAELLRDAVHPSKAISVPLSSELQSSPSQESIAYSPRLESNQDQKPTTSFSIKDISDLIDSTYRNATRLGKLTKDILEVARIDNHTLKTEKEAFDLNETIREAASDCRKSPVLDRDGRSPGPHILFDLESSELIVNADKTMIYEIISNLLSNAIRYTKDGKKITIEAKKTGDSVTVTVTDEGNGIDPEIFPRLFGKFVTKYGTGLGLYISKGYAEAHGGRIWAENGRNGRGASFSFSLPLNS